MLKEGQGSHLVHVASLLYRNRQGNKVFFVFLRQQGFVYHRGRGLSPTPTLESEGPAWWWSA